MYHCLGYVCCCPRLGAPYPEKGITGPHPVVIILNSDQDTDPKKVHGQFHDDSSRRLTFKAITSKKFTDGWTLDE